MHLASNSTSRLKIFPAVSTATPLGVAKVAAVGCPPSPLEPYEPSPTTVVIIPVVSILRILLLATSAIYIFPELSNVIPRGLCKSALVAGPPSPP